MIFKNRTNSSPTSIIQQYIYPHPICNILTRLKQYIPPSQGVNMICLLWLSQLTNYWISLLNQAAISCLFENDFTPAVSRRAPQALPSSCCQWQLPELLAR